MLFILQNINDLIYAIWLQWWLEDSNSPVAEVLQSLIYCLVLELISIFNCSFTNHPQYLSLKQKKQHFISHVSASWPEPCWMLFCSLWKLGLDYPKLDQTTQVFALESGLLARRPGKDVSWEVLSLFPRPSLDYFITFHSGWTYCMVADFPRRRWSK